VKYKLTATGIARNADYYQLLAYATALKLPRGILVYCQAAEALEREIVVNGGGQRLTVVPLGLGGTWEQIGVRLDRLARSVLALSIGSI
jgi:5-methylcytosine-specific restriction enzyme subunit McrC